MKINELKKGIVNAFLSNPLDDKTDELIISCLLYDFTKKIVENETNLENNVKLLAANYLPSFIKNLNEYKQSFIAYITMRETVESYKKDSFLQFTSEDITRINDLYKSRVQIKKFSTNYFSQYMYKLINISDYHYKRLADIHKRIMTPIIKFYVDNYGLSDSDMEIYSSQEYLENPGKDILFSIKGIDPARVVNDVNFFRIPIKKPSDFFEIRVYKNYVRLINN
jgi:hypothetical protein